MVLVLGNLGQFDLSDLDNLKLDLQHNQLQLPLVFLLHLNPSH